MNWADGLQRAVDYVEMHLEEDIDYAEVARQACSSSFHFQRVFGILCGCTLGDYIRRRRLSQAGAELAASDCKVIDVALRYGYESPESFSRAFAKFHGITPSEAKTGQSGLKSFSRLSVKLVIEGGTTMDYRIEKKDAFKIAAKKATYSGSKEVTQKNIHDMWETCMKDGTIEKLCKYVNPQNVFGDAIVGISYNNPDGGAFDYAIAVACTEKEVTDGLSLETVPAGTWAIFPYSGKMPGAFEELWKKIYTEFFPASRYEPVSGPVGMFVEVYPSAEVNVENYSFEIWISVAQK